MSTQESRAVGTSSWMYASLDEAQEALEIAIVETLRDNPDLEEGEVAHDLAIAIAWSVEPLVRRQFLQGEIGWVPGPDDDLFAREGC